ncbi:flagellar biosynthetic protein FliO [Burkholderia ubonensis]|uniref:flagellar biosynthetic protein FliO n=1 Tax=Burkholderia ubonensis TaxID=101571 RepID=UPI00210C2C74|nr:flagellar biosynthetic protein FliO [Burkholderia ubonensis]
MPISAASCAAAGTPSSSSIALGPVIGGGIDLLRIGGALALCIALGIAAIFVLRRYGFGPTDGRGASAGQKRLTIVETARLATRVTLHVVEYDERRVLLALDANGITLLDAHSRPASETTS